MLTPAEFSERLDSFLLRSRDAGFDLAHALQALLADLPPEDRQGLDPEVLEMRILARNWFHRRAVG